jgi:cyclopropane-fatty-acyl-phospholipid synthase
MMTSKSAVRKLLAEAGVTVGGNRHWDIQVKDERFYDRVLAQKNLGLGETYMEGLWECPRIDAFICRVLKAELDRRVRGDWRLVLGFALALLSNLPAKAAARRMARQHYDLGNALFFSFLDPYKQYSCAYFDGTDELHEAQRRKMALICRKLELNGGDHLLDIGFGWGGLARYAAERHGCRVTGINISGEQIDFARRFCRGLPVRLKACDYRDLRGRFDKIVSVGMFEHVGSRNYRTFMRAVHRCLKRDGIFLLQTIGGNTPNANCDPWIRRYIFPHSMLPAMSQIQAAAEGLFVLEDLHNLGPHYDKTLMAWHRAFLDAWPRLRETCDRRFRRMWAYYLLSCAGAFRARSLQLWQLVFTKLGRVQPACRRRGQ